MTTVNIDPGRLRAVADALEHIGHSMLALAEDVRRMGLPPPQLPSRQPREP